MLSRKTLCISKVKSKETKFRYDLTIYSHRRLNFQFMLPEILHNQNRRNILPDLRFIVTFKSDVQDGNWAYIMRKLYPYF
jgi:hypothetical protein